MKFIHNFFCNYEFELSENDRDSMIYIGIVDNRQRAIIVGNEQALRASLVAACLSREDIRDLVMNSAMQIIDLHNEGIDTFDEYIKKRGL